MNMLIHDELKIVRHTLDVLRSEVEYLRMSIRDLGTDDVDYDLLVMHADLVLLGTRFKTYETSLKAQL